MKLDQLIELLQAVKASRAASINQNTNPTVCFWSWNTDRDFGLAEHYVDVPATEINERASTFDGDLLLQLVEL